MWALAKFGTPVAATRRLRSARSPPNARSRTLLLTAKGPLLGRCGLKPIAPRVTERAARTILRARCPVARVAREDRPSTGLGGERGAMRGSADRTVETLGPRGARYASRIARTPPASLALAT